MGKMDYGSRYEVRGFRNFELKTSNSELQLSAFSLHPFSLNTYILVENRNLFVKSERGRSINPYRKVHLVYLVCLVCLIERN